MVTLLRHYFDHFYGGGDVNIRVLLSMLASLGAPLALHWAFSSEKSTRDDEERK